RESPDLTRPRHLQPGLPLPVLADADNFLLVAVRFGEIHRGVVPPDRDALGGLSGTSSYLRWVRTGGSPLVAPPLGAAGRGWGGRGRGRLMKRSRRPSCSTCRARALSRSLRVTMPTALRGSSADTTGSRARSHSATRSAAVRSKAWAMIERQAPPVMMIGPS